MKPSSAAPDRLRTGRRGEALARRALEREGYVIEAANARVPGGELDLVAWDGPVLCFIEIRSTSSDEWGGPLETIRWPKQRRLIRAAHWYLAGLSELPEQTRFDVVAVVWEASGAPRVELIRGAFETS